MAKTKYAASKFDRYTRNFYEKYQLSKRNCKVEENVLQSSILLNNRFYILFVEGIVRKGLKRA